MPPRRRRRNPRTGQVVPQPRRAGLGLLFLLHLHLPKLHGGGHELGHVHHPRRHGWRPLGRRQGQRPTALHPDAAVVGGAQRQDAEQHLLLKLVWGDAQPQAGRIRGGHRDRTLAFHYQGASAATAQTLRRGMQRGDEGRKGGRWRPHNQRQFLLLGRDVATEVVFQRGVSDS